MYFIMEITDIEGYFNEWKKRLRFASQLARIVGPLAFFTFIGAYFHTVYPTSTNYNIASIGFFILTTILFAVAMSAYIVAFIKTLKFIKRITNADLKEEKVLINEMELSWNKIIHLANIFSFSGFFLLNVSLNLSILAYHYEFGLFSTVILWLYFFCFIAFLSSRKKHFIER